MKRSNTKRPMAVTLTILLILTLLLSGSNTAMALNPPWSPLDGPHHQEEMKVYSHPDWGLSFLYPTPWTIQEEAEIVWAIDFSRMDLGDIAIFAVMAGPGVSGKSLLDVLHSFEIEELKAEPSMPRSIAGQTGEGAMFQGVEPVTGMAMTGYIALFKRGEMAFALIAMATSDTWAERWPVLEMMINSLSFEGAVVPPARTPLPLLPTEVPPPPEGPTITTLDPLYGPVGTQVTIQGSGFGPSQGDSLVTFNSIPLGSENILSWEENQIVFSVPVGAVSGPVQVLVGEGASNRVGFVVSSTFTEARPEDFLVDPETGIELVRGEILISFRPGTAQETIEGIISNVDGKTLGYDPWMDVYQVAIPQTEPAEIDQVVDRLAELEEVTFVSPRLGSVGEQVSPVDGEYPPGAWDLGSAEPTNWGLRFINMPLAWDATIGNAAVRAAVVDNGFDLGHEDLAGNIFVIGPGNSAADHGTHVAGIVGAQGNNGEGISGVNWQVGLCLFDYDYGTGNSDWTSITNRMMEAIDRGARVINLSAGINWWRIRDDQGRRPPREEPLTPDEIAYSQKLGQLMARVPTYAAATNRDVLFVFSAGNDSIPAQYNGTPWLLPLFNNILVVANIEPDGSRADSSNYGPYVSVAAPGDEIYSTVTGPQRYDYLSGTSMAAPHVTGLTALLWAMNPSLSASQVRDCILAGAASRGAPVGEKYEPAFGPHGFYAIDAPKALDACRDKAPQPVFQPVPAWKQPAVIACIEDWIQKYTAAMNQLRPERAPWHIDQYGHLIGRLMEGYAPDDWITRWEGNRYKRIWYGYANASVPGVPRLRDYCGGKVDPSPVPVPPPVPPAPGTEPWNDPAVQDCIQKWMRVVEAYYNKTRPERAPWHFSEYGQLIGQLMSYQKPDNWDTIYEGNLYKWMWLVWGEASYPGIPSLKDVCQGGAPLPTLPLPGVEKLEEPTPTPTWVPTLAPTPTPTATPGRPSTVSPITFYAVYDRLVDADSQNVRISQAAMSGDGNKLIFAGNDNTTGNLVLCMVNADSTGLTQIALPDLGGRGITELAIDQDGSRAFFRASGAYTTSQLYKVEGGAVTRLLDAADPDPDLASIGQIQCTADGEYVYFLNSGGYNGDVWRIGHGGGGLEKVIEDRDVSSNTTYGVDQFAISADASTIAFLLDPLGEHYPKKELFILDGGGYRQLTNDRVDKFNLAISGDSTTIVFAAENKRYSIRSDGSAKIALEDAAFNFGGLDLTYDGTKMFYSDAGANGGRLTNTDGLGRIDLFPWWNVTNIAIAVSGSASISDDGRRVAFVFDGLYVGYLNDPAAVPDAPIIHNIAFDPPVMPNDDPNARIIVTSQISDPQGLSDVTKVSTDELLDGRLGRGTENLPVYFYFDANDTGSPPDQPAGDGIFSTEGKPGGKIGELNQMTVRMGAMDASKTVVVADTVLPIGSRP